MNIALQSNHATGRRGYVCLPCRSVQRGTSMVEVLVALVVMSVGLLGIAGLYVTTLQAKTTSGSRMKAVNLAYDLADRIRANPTAGADYALAFSATPTAAGATCIQPKSSVTAANCSTQQMARADLAHWIALATDSTTGTGLPGAVRYRIVDTPATATAREVITIDLRWTEAATGSAELAYALQIQL